MATGIFDNNWGSVSWPAGEGGYFAGETVTITAVQSTPPSDPAPASFTIFGSSAPSYTTSDLVSGAIGTTQSFTFPNDNFYEIGWKTDNTYSAYFTVTCSAAPSPDPAPAMPANAAPVATYTLTSNPEDRGTCWPTVSGVSGTWVKLTDSGCAPPKPGATLLGWATSPLFPVAEARKVVGNGWTAYDGSINGVRMVFIPVNGYTALTGDQTMYPIWST